MELKQILELRRSTRKFTDREVAADVTERILKAALSAPSSRNSRSTRILVVENREKIAKMAEMRDYGSAFLKNAPLAFVIAGDRSAADLWRENGAIAATILQLACVDEELASCWVHVDGRPRVQAQPDGEQAADYLRTLLPIPAEWDVLCVIAAGYSDFHPAELPPYDWHSAIMEVK